MKKITIILINILGMLFFITPGVAVTERILNYSTLYLLFKISQNPILLAYMIAGLVLFSLLIVLIIYVQIKKKQNIFIFIAISFSILIGIISSRFWHSFSIPIEDLLFFLFGIAWFQVLTVLTILGKAKDLTFKTVQNNMNNASFLFYKVFAYGFLIAFYINRFSESDDIVAKFVNIHDNLFVQVFSVLASIAVFTNAEKIIEAIGKKIILLQAVFKSKLLIEDNK
jgi:hypothetical protein